MRTKKRRQSLAASAISWLMTFAVILGMFPAMTTTANAEEPSGGSGNTLTEAEANALLAGAGTSLIDIALKNNYTDYDTKNAQGGSGHMQGICVDDKLEYLYFSYTDALVQVSLATGEVTGSVGGFGAGSFGTSGGAHLGCLEYYDGWVYGSLEYKSPGAKFFVAAFDTSKITKIGMDVKEMESGVNAILLKEPTEDFRDPLNYGGTYATNNKNDGHCLGCSGIDGITMGCMPGDTSGDVYMILAYGVYGGYENRYDDRYNVLQFYKVSDFWNTQTKQPVGTQNIRFTYERGLTFDYTESEVLAAADTLYVWTGNTSWGSQNLEYEWDTGDIVLYTYGSMESGWGISSVIVVDGSEEPVVRELEVGQSASDANDDAKERAECYKVNGEYPKVKHAVIKCVCGHPENHTATTVGDDTWGNSGIKKADLPICSMSGVPHSGTYGVHWLGAENDNVDYFYIANGDYTAGLYKRTTNTNGSMSFTKVVPDVKAQKLVHYSMDASDTYTRDGVTYMKNTLDDAGTYDAVVEGTTTGVGVDGKTDGALSFNAWNYPAEVDQMYLNGETISYINRMSAKSAYSYSFWAKMAVDTDTDGNFNPFIGFYRSDGTYAGVFEQRWRNKIKYVVNGIGAAAAGNPGDSGSYIGRETCPGDENWHFFTVTENAGYGVVYLDGEKKCDYTVSETHLKDDPITDFVIGGGVAKLWYDMNNRGRLIGSVDDLTIYSGALTADEVTAAYQERTKTDTTSVTVIGAAVSPAPAEKLRAAYDVTADADKPLTIDVGVAVTEITGLTAGTDYTVSGNSVTFISEWLKKQTCGIKCLTLNGTVELELTITDPDVPVLNYSFAASSVSGTTVKDQSVYGVNAMTTTNTFAKGHSNKNDSALVFDGYDYDEPTYVKLDVDDAAWLNSVLKSGYTINFWANASSENGNKMSFAGLYAKDGRPLGALETYDLDDITDASGNGNVGNTKIDGKMTIRADVGVTGNITSNGYSKAAQSSAQVETNKWAMYTMTYDKTSQKLNLYINGEPAGEVEVGDTVLGQISQLFIGHQYHKYYFDKTHEGYDWTTRGGFKGAMDNFVVYNNALSAEKIKGLYEGQAVTPAYKTSPVLHWSMDADTLNEDGTITETAKGYTSYWQNVTPVEGVDGKDGGAVYFDGTNDSGEYSRVWLSDSGVKDLNADVDKALTLSFWMKPDSTQTQESLPYTAAWSPVGGIFGESDNRFLMVAEYRDNQLVYSAQSGSDKRIYSSTLKDQWYYVVMTFDGEAADTALSTTNNYRRIFITGEDGVTYEYAAVNGSVGSITANGNNATSRQFNTPGLYNNITHVEFGGQYAKGHWTDTNVRGRYVGAVDDVKIYNIAFQKADVEALYQVTPTTSAAAQTTVAAQGTSVVLPTTYFTADTVIFDKAAPADMTFTVEFGSSVTAVSAAGLTAEDYTISGKTVTISKDWLAQQQPGEVNLAVTSSGKTNTMVLHVINNTSNDSTQPYPVLYYKMDAADLTTTKNANGNVSGTLADASGHGIDLNVGGLTTAKANKDNTANSSIFFDGYRDYDVSRAWLDDEGMAYLKDALKTGDVSYSFWLASDRISSNYMPVMGLYGADNRPLAVANFTASYAANTSGLGKSTAPTLTAVSKGVTDYTEGDYKSATTVAMDSAWHHYVMTYKADGTVVIYMDGEQVYTGTADKNQLASIDAFELGGMVNPNYYNHISMSNMNKGGVRGRLYGNLDEVKVFNVALTQDNVTSLYNAGVSGSLPEDSTGVKVLNSITVTAPTKTEYAVNETLSVAGGKVTVSYTDGTSKTIDLTAGMVSGFDSSEGVDSQTLTVSYTLNGVTKTDTFTVKVVKKVVAIAMTAMPKTAYEVGETLDVTGGKITVTYDDGSTVETALTADMVSGFDSSKGGAKTLTVSYTENGVTKTTDLGVSVGKRIASIAVTTTPKTEYKVGDTLDTTGGKITLTYNDKTTEVIDLLVGMVTGFDSSKGVASQTLTVTYSDFTATYTVSVVKSLASIRVEGLTTNYFVGDSLNVTGAKVVKVYDDKTEEIVALTADMVSGFDSSAADTNTVTVSYTENGVTQTAQVALTIRNYSSGSSSGSSSSGVSGSKYPVSVDNSKNGAVSADAATAKKGETVTITIKPNSGYELKDLTVIDKDGNELKLTQRSGTRYTFTMPASKVTVNAVFAAETAEQNWFVDVPATAYFYDAVKWAVDKGVTLGTDETHFSPGNSCTRAQIVTFLWRAAGCPEPANASSFTDVSTGGYYAKAVAWAVENGITNGYADGTFGVNTPCTRAHAVAFLFRYAAAVGMDAVTLQELVSSFNDAAQVPSYALSAFNWALAKGVVQGNNGSLMANNTCTRAQIVTMLYRLFGE